MTVFRRLFVAALAAASTTATSSIAAADEPRLTVPARRLVVHASLEVSLSADAAFEPVSVAPDLWYGVTRSLTVGLVHSSRALGGVLGGSGDGLCLTGEDGGCGAVYDGGGLLARLHLAGGPLALALDGGLLAHGLDPLTLGLKLGLAARLQLGRLAVELAPNAWVALNERDAGNRELVNVPVTLTLAVTPRVALAVQSAMVAPLEDFRRDIFITLSAGVQAVVTEQIFVDVVFSLPHWLDTDLDTYGLDARTLTLGVGRAF